MQFYFMKIVIIVKYDKIMIYQNLRHTRIKKKCNYSKVTQDNFYHNYFKICLRNSLQKQLVLEA